MLTKHIPVTDCEVGGWLGASTSSMPRVTVIGDGAPLLWRGCFRWVPRPANMSNPFDIPLSVASMLYSLTCKPGDRVFLPYGPVQPSLVTLAESMGLDVDHAELDKED